MNNVTRKLAKFKLLTKSEGLDGKLHSVGKKIESFYC